MSIQKLNAENIKEHLVETVSAADLGGILSKVKNYVFIKPAKTQESVPWGEILSKTKSEFMIILKILSRKPIYLSIYWTLSMILTFGFWDTFAASFLVDFLNNIKPGWSYALL